MNTNHIQYFYDAHRLNSVFKAAALNHVAPSTVSQAIRILEGELGYKLTQKKRGSLEITKEGIAFASQAMEIIGIIDRVKKKPLRNDSELSGVLKIATHQSFLNSYLWPKLRTFRKRHPKVEVQITTGIGAQISELLESQQIDIAVTLDEIRVVNSRSVSSQVLIDGEFRLVSSYTQKLDKEAGCIVTNANKPEVAFLLRKAPWLVIDSQIPSWTTIQKVISKEPLFGYLPDYLLSSEGKGDNYKEPRFAAALRFPYQVKIWTHSKNHNSQLIQSLIGMI